MALSSDPDELLTAALAGDRRALARCISIVEDDRVGSAELVTAAYARAGSAHVIGITGSPGAGKSTLTDRLLTKARVQHGQVAVVAVDPSSPLTGGAMLGDRIRMQEHVSDPGVFVRSMSSRGRLGGLADSTAKVVTVVDSCRFNPVFVETVGVGQSEVEVMDLADTVLVVVAPGMGDGIQAAKAGLLEIGHVFVVNKADRPGAEEVARDLSQMIELGVPGDWTPPIVTCIATTDEGIEGVVEAIDSHRLHLAEGDRLRLRRTAQAETTLKRAVLRRLSARLNDDALGVDTLANVLSRTTDPWAAARRMVP